MFVFCLFVCFLAVQQRDTANLSCRIFNIGNRLFFLFFGWFCLTFYSTLAAGFFSSFFFDILFNISSRFFFFYLLFNIGSRFLFFFFFFVCLFVCPFIHHSVFNIGSRFSFFCFVLVVCLTIFIH